MTGVTPNYAIPYPTGTDLLADAVQSIPQAMATAVDSSLGQVIAAAGGAAPTAWQDIPYRAGVWGPYPDVSFHRPQYRKFMGEVVLRGYVFSLVAATAQITTALPVNHRPALTDDWLCLTGASNNTVRGIRITAGGIISCSDGLASGQNTLISLNGIRWQYGT